MAESELSSSADDFSTKTEPELAALDGTAAASIPDAERLAPQVTSTSLDLHLNRESGAMDARARVVIRNSGSMPMTRVVLQISSALRWQSASLIATAGPQRLVFEQHSLTTDADHTGAAAEVAVTLPKPLAPGATATLDLLYGGKLAESAERLLRLGAPASKAAASDWDMVRPDFVGVRGFGNVLWYPASAAPALLADGENFAHTIDEQRRRGLDATMSVRLILESSGPAPDAAFLNSRRMTLAEVRVPGEPAAKTSVELAGASPTDAGNSSGDEPSRLFTAEWPSAPLGDHLPSLFVSDHVPETSGGSDALLRVSTTDGAISASYAAAEQRLRPFLEEWLGPRRAHVLQVLPLPGEATQPFADGSLLVVPLRDTAPEAELTASLVYPMVSAAVPAGAAPWLAQGLPEFLRLVYLERQEGRERALAVLDTGVGALQQVEASPSAPLRECVDAACARTKAAFALMMLRQLAGDDALKAALPTLLAGSADGAGHVTANFEATLQRVSGKNLRWFFADWFDRDAGLPELTIVTVAPRLIERGSVHTVVPTERRPVGGPVGDEPVAQRNGPLDRETPTEASRNRAALPDGSWLVAVEVQNAGDAAAEVPVTVRSGSLQNTLPLRIPAHGRATIRVPFETSPEEVIVNDGTTPEQRGTTHRRHIEIPAQAR